MPALAVIVDYEIDAGREGEFIAVMREHARKSLDEEPGCLRLEILQPLDDDATPIRGRVIASEAYVNEAALAHHERNPSRTALNAAIGPMVRGQRRIVARVADGEVIDEGLRPEDLNSANDG